MRQTGSRTISMSQAIKETTQQTQSICIALIQCRPNFVDLGPTLYKCNTDVLCLLGMTSQAAN